ncbi:thiamine pyrophosphate-binding protein [Sporolactobacillus putidus]|uniref:Acetolactate synthase n=1 Tax=Sporolactobacillus putidus TaxID=492735 RepID=A0A917SBE4_9BACL|nr:thiamine pyrophosphate-binding protein [Sporolactobacillus putidus]GGL65740.1 acetolactate synthase [Sporolactobacillus putidus]
MKAVKPVVDFLVSGGVKYIFGIPAGSVNAFFDELYERREITPIVAKHEGAASYMAAAYARNSGQLGVCIGCSGPGSTNLLTGAANAMREQLPVLFITGAVPTNTVGLNASQELSVEPMYRPVTKYSVTVSKAEDLVKEAAKAVKIALSGIPGPVHVAMPIDLQLEQISSSECPPFPSVEKISPAKEDIAALAGELLNRKKGVLFVGQGARDAVPELLEVAELLNWPIITTPQAKGLIPESHPLSKGIFGFAGHEEASLLINEGARDVLFVIGSSLGETATNNYNERLTAGRYVIQMDRDQTVFGRKYPVDMTILGDSRESLMLLAVELRNRGLRPETKTFAPFREISAPPASEAYNTQNVLLKIQQSLPETTRYTVDIGEFMSYVVHYMKVQTVHSFDINVHFGAMGTAIGSAIGMSLADSARPSACITGDGCFFMHGMEILTAKEYNLPILFIVMNNARLGMVYHGHALQYKRVHERFEQQPVSIAKMAEAMDIPSYQIRSMGDIEEKEIQNLLDRKGPAVLEVSLVDNNIPPMGDRVKFLSSFGK